MCAIIANKISIFIYIAIYLTIYILVALDMRTLLDRNNFSSKTNGQVAARRVTGLISEKRSMVFMSIFMSVLLWYNIGTFSITHADANRVLGSESVRVNWLETRTAF